MPSLKKILSMRLVITSVFISISFNSILFSQIITTDSLFSSLLNRNWKFNVYLPPNYSDSDSIKIIYLLHGSGGDENDWNEGIILIDSLINDKLICQMIAVAPASGTSWWVDGNEPFEKAFFEELRPYIEKKYKVKRSRNGNYIAGFSMGGYGALRYALAYPNKFSIAILLSPAIYNKLPPDGSSAIKSGSFGRPFNAEVWIKRNYPNLLTSNLLKNNPVELFIVAGDDDWNHPEGTEYNIDWQVNLLYSKYHKELEYPAELRIINGGHDWSLWNKGLIDAMKLLKCR